MPKSEMGISAKAKAKAKAAVKVAEADTAAEDAGWAASANPKSKSAAAKEAASAKAEAAKLRKQEDRELAAQEDREMAKISGKGAGKGVGTKKGAQPKMTQAMIAQARALREAEEKKAHAKRKKEQSRMVDAGDYERLVDQANRNVAVGDDVAATGIDGALAAVGGDAARIQMMATAAGATAGGKDQKMAAKGRMTYKIFETTKIPELKDQKPGLQGSQYRDLCKKEWKRSPMNPANSGSVA